MQKIKGKTWKVGHDVDTDVIIAARYLNTSDPEILAEHCLEDLIPDILNKVKQGDVLIAGKNFGCGSSREHAPIAIKQAGFACVIAESYARIFYRNSINIGLPIIVSYEAANDIKEDEIVEVNPVTGEINNVTTGRKYQGEPFPPFMMEILENGGVIPYIKEKVKKGV